MPKAAKKSNHVDNTSKNEFQADSNLSNESSSDDEVVLQSPQFKPSTSQMQANVYALHRRTKNGLDCE